MKALQIAATGMAAQQMKVDVVANNLANMSTTGYNPRRADFADLHYQQMARPGSVSAADGSMLPTGVQIGLGKVRRDTGKSRRLDRRMEVRRHSRTAHQARGRRLDLVARGRVDHGSLSRNR